MAPVTGPASPAAARRYGGASAAERAAERRARFLDAGLELLGTRGVAGTTVRGLAEETGLAARYFYESFRTLEELQVAVFDRIAEEALTRALTALAGATQSPEVDADDTDDTDDTVHARTRAVLAEMVDLNLSDPRVGRIILVEAVSSPALAARVLEESRRVAAMLAATAAHGDPAADVAQVPLELRVTAQFLLGGVAHTLRAALEGDLPVGRDELTDILVGLFLSVDRSRRET